MADEVPFDGIQERLLPLADLVMVLMWSRPASGTLRNTRVTVVTIALAVVVALVALWLAMLGVLLTVSGGSILWLAAAMVLLALSFGCADLGFYGVRQRLMMRRR